MDLDLQLFTSLLHRGLLNHASRGPQLILFNIMLYVCVCGLYHGYVRVASMCVCVCAFVSSCPATKVLIGKYLPQEGWWYQYQQMLTSLLHDIDWGSLNHASRDS